MTQLIRVRNVRGEWVEPKTVSASEAKSVGRILDYVANDGGVTITRRSAPFAMVIPVETYARLVALEQASLGTLAAQFDSAMERAFRMRPEDLGRAAAQQAQATKGAAPKPTRGRVRKQRGAA
jgi:prevent-host-death family protein